MCFLVTFCTMYCFRSRGRQTFPIFKIFCILFPKMPKTCLSVTTYTAEYLRLFRVAVKCAKRYLLLTGFPATHIGGPAVHRSPRLPPVYACKKCPCIYVMLVHGTSTQNASFRATMCLFGGTNDVPLNAMGQTLNFWGHE